jgi:hypothetical protein
MQQALLTTRQAAGTPGLSEYFLERDRCTTAPFLSSVSGPAQCVTAPKTLTSLSRQVRRSTADQEISSPRGRPLQQNVHCTQPTARGIGG